MVTAKQVHQHHHHQTTPATVSLETHQTDRGANTTIAATTHHLHEMEVSSLLKNALLIKSSFHLHVGVGCTQNIKKVYFVGARD